MTMTISEPMTTLAIGLLLLAVSRGVRALNLRLTAAESAANR